MSYRLPSRKRFYRRKKDIEKVESILYSAKDSLTTIKMKTLETKSGPFYRMEALTRLESQFKNVLYDKYAMEINAAYSSTSHFAVIDHYFEDLFTLPRRSKDYEFNARNILFMYETFIRICRLELWLREIAKQGTGIWNIINDFSGKEVPEHIQVKVVSFLDELKDLDINAYSKVIWKGEMEEDFGPVIVEALTRKVNRLKVKVHNRALTVVSKNIRDLGYQVWRKNGQKKDS